MALKVTMFSDFVCPFCYIGFETLRALKGEFSFAFEWRGFQIHPEWPAEGIAAERRRESGDPESRRATWDRIKEVADGIGLQLRAPELLSNSRLALQAAELAQDIGAGEALEERIYRAYFHDGADIGDPAVIGRLAEESGIERARLADAFSSGSYALRLKNNALVAHQRGVSGVPTFFINGFQLVGAQSTDAMRRILRRAAERLEAVD